jgi:hydroxypyruvate isomerase
MTLRFAPNLSLLWAGLPLADRFERAAAAGFGAVELWWPGDDDALALPGLTERWGLHLALLNFDAGDMPGGDRGLAADPDRVAQLRANVPLALRIAQECGCSRLNLLAGLRDERYPLAEQLRLARDNVLWAADQAARAGCQVLVEAVNSRENGPYLLTTTAAAAGFVREVARENVRLQYDAYHMQRMEGDLTTTLDTYWELISHIQVADVPGRGEPGTGELNYRYLFDHLDGKGYDGWIGLEYRPSTGVPEDSFGWLELLGRPRGHGQKESRRA